MLYLYVHIANINHLILPYNQLEHTKLKNRWQMNISDHFPTRIVIKIRELIGIRSNLKIKCDLLTHKIQIWRPNSKLRWSKDKLFVVFAVFFPLLQSSRCAHNSLINVKAYVCIKFMCILTKKSQDPTLQSTRTHKIEKSLANEYYRSQWFYCLTEFINDIDSNSKLNINDWQFHLPLCTHSYIQVRFLYGTCVEP